MAFTRSHHTNDEKVVNADGCGDGLFTHLQCLALLRYFAGRAQERAPNRSELGAGASITFLEGCGVVAMVDAVPGSIEAVQREREDLEQVFVRDLRVEEYFVERKAGRTLIPFLLDKVASAME